MKKGALHFLGRKNQSLFDTNIRIKDMDNVELVLDSPAILESGTASVRARPTVKHHTSSDNFQAFAVPTPKVPLLPPVSGPKVNGSVDGDNLSNGSVISVPDAVEGEIFIPPPPSMAPPPPPPGTFILPPPDFIGDLNSPALAASQPPAPKVSPLPLPMDDDDLASLKPPPMAPPKPPSTCSTGSASSIPFTSSPPVSVPDHPKFAPPQPPIEKQQKNLKTPPPKPVRLSSISNFDLPPQTPAPPPPEQTPTRSTFNPQNTAKIYSVPKLSLLSRNENHETKPKQMLLLEDSGSVNSVPVIVPVNGKATNVDTPPKSVSRDMQELKENLQITKPTQPSLPEPNKEAKTGRVSAQLEVTKPPQTRPQKSPQIQKINSSYANSDSTKDELVEPPRQGCKFSPLLDRKLRNLKNSETTGAREMPAASPLALLMAAKEREKHRPTQSLSRENSGKRDEQPSASIYPSDSSPNSFVVVPKTSLPSSTSQERMRLNQSQIIQTPEKSTSPFLVSDHMKSTSPARSGFTAAATVHAKDPVGLKHNAEQSPPKSAQPWDNGEEVSVPLLPPPPEFDDLEEIMDPPPSICPPDPPVKTAPKPAKSLPPPGPPPPKHKPPAPPKLPPPVIDTKPKPQKAPSQLPTPLSPNQATLLSILQKKMLEMDHKMAAVKEAESTSDDWGSPLSDEDNKIPVAPKTQPQSKNYPALNKTNSLDMRELEDKVTRGNKDISTKVPTSNGPSKHQYGMSFTIRPGTKQPITPITRLES